MIGITRLLKHTCTVTRSGVAVATGVACLFQERHEARVVTVLDGLQSEPGERAQFTVTFGPSADVLEHDQLSVVTFPDDTTDSRRFTVQLVITARNPEGPVYKTAWAKVS